ncbi:MAG: TolC family protein [Acidobacteria bacterium]|nr:TolC family protein [Acidobacteriota bacterium]
MLAGLLLAGCAHQAPPPPDLEIPLPAHWTAPPAADSALTATVAPGFDLGNADLADVVAEALEHNHDLVAAAARLEQAAARARIAGGARVPQVSAGLDAARGKRNFIGLPIPGTDGSVLSSTSTTLGVSLNVSWEVDLWGRLAAGRSAAAADLEAARSDLEAARRSLAAQTAKSWIAAVAARRQLELAQTTLASRDETLGKIRRRYEVGLRSSLDLRLAEADRAGAAAAAVARRLDLDTALRQLEILLGRYPAAQLVLPAGLPELDGPVAAGLPSEVLTRRPDLAAAERRVAAAGARVAEARAALYPQLRLTGSAGTSSDQVADLLDGDFSVWSFAGSLLQPLFQGGRLRAGVDLAAAGADEALAAYASAVLRALGEVETALAAEKGLAEQETALAAAALQAEAARRLAEERYETGLGEYLVVLESQRGAVDTASRRLEVQRQRLVARIDLYLALGGDLPPAESGSGDPTPETR